MTRKRIIFILKYLLFLGLGISLLYLSVKDIDYNSIKHSLANANYFYIVLTIIALILSHYFRALRWKILIEATDHKVSTSGTFASVMVGYGFNILVPRGGEFVRCTSLHTSDKVPFAVGFGTVITERLCDLLVLITLFLTLLFLEFDKIGEVWNNLVSEGKNAPVQEGMSLKMMVLIGLGIGFMISLVLFFIYRKKITGSAFWSKLIGFGKTLRESLASIFRMKRPFFFFIYTIVIWGLYLIMTYLPFLAIQETNYLDFYFSFIVLTLGGIGFIFPSPGGTGSYHIAVQTTFKVFRNAGPAGAIYAILAHGFQTIVTLLLGVIGFFYLRALKRKHDLLENQIQ